MKYCGAAYLVWLGIQTLRAEAKSADAVAQSGGALWQDMGLGLLVTLGNPKPIVFYGAFLPTFLDLTVIGVMDFVILMSIVMAVSYVVYAGYILLAQRTRRLFASTRTIKRLNQATGAMLVGTGIAVAAR